MPNRKISGIIHITLSALFFGSYGVWSKLMGNSFGEFSQGWTRAALLLALLIPIGIYKQQFKPVKRKDWIWFGLVSLGGLNQAPYFYAFEHMDIGTATLLFYASLTIGGYMVGKIVLKEHIGTIKILSLLLALLGMVILYGMNIKLGNLLPGASAILAGLIGGVEVSTSKKISDRYSNIQILVVLFIVMLVGNLPFGLLRHEMIPTVTDTAWLAQIGYTLSMLGAMYFVIKGFKYIEASVGSIVGLSEILFAIIFGMIFFGEYLTFAMFVGGMLIIGAGVLPNISVGRK